MNQVFTIITTIVMVAALIWCLVVAVIGLVKLIKRKIKVRKLIKKNESKKDK